MEIAKGIELLGETQGKGSVVIYDARIFLRTGDEVTFEADSIVACPLFRINNIG